MIGYAVDSLQIVSQVLVLSNFVSACTCDSIFDGLLRSCKLAVKYS